MPSGHTVRFSDEQVSEIVRMYESGLTIGRIAKHFGVSDTPIKTLFRKIGYKNRPGNRRFTINEHVFDTIDNEGAAYWLGFIYADGCVKNHILQVILAEKDWEHVQRLATFLGSNTPVGHDHYLSGGGKPRARLVVSGIHLTDRLKELGIVVGRGLEHKMIEAIHPSVFHHWLRGFFDGDGCASTPPTLSFCGPEHLLLYLRDRLAIEAESNPNRQLTKNSRSNVVQYLVYHRHRTAQPIADYMYRDWTICLPRKLERIQSWGRPISYSERSRLGWIKRHSSPTP